MCQIPKNFVTSDLVHHLRGDKPKVTIPEKSHVVIHKNWNNPRFMFVLEDGDLNTAAHYLAERMHEPFDPFPIACVAVQQSVHDDFIERVRNLFHQLKPHVATHPTFERTLKELEFGAVKHVLADESNAPSIASPIIVTDNVTQLYFSSRPSGVVTLKSFNTIREAADIFRHEQPQFDAVYVFDESITSVYALASRISCFQFFVNCVDVCLIPILPYYGLRQACSLMQGGFHFEALDINYVWRIIVFPYTTTFVRRCSCLPHQCTCHIDRKICG